MVRVPLPLWGVAVLLLAASTVVGQTPEPPAELPLDPLSPGSADFLRQFSAEKHHPLLNLMVDGELTSYDSTPAPESSRLTPKPQTPSASSTTATEETCPVEIESPAMPMCLPYAYPPPPPPSCGHKWRHRKHHGAQCGGNGPGYGNPYLGWPCAMGGYPGCYGAPPYPYQGCSGHRCHHKHGGYNAFANSGYGSPYGGGYGGGWNSMGGDGFFDGNSCGGCTPYLAPPPPPPQCHCRKCQRKHGHGQQGYGYGSPYGGGGYGGYGNPYGGGGYNGGMMGYDGFMEGGFGGGCASYAPPPPPPQCHCRKCQRKHGSHGYGYAGCGYPGWPAYPVPGANMVDGGYNGFADPNCFGCGKHRHCHSLFHHCRHHTPQYPYYAYPRMMPCMMEAEPFCADCAFEGASSPAPSSATTTK